MDNQGYPIVGHLHMYVRKIGVSMCFPTRQTFFLFFLFPHLDSKIGKIWCSGVLTGKYLRDSPYAKKVRWWSLSRRILRAGASEFFGNAGAFGAYEFFGRKVIQQSWNDCVVENDVLLNKSLTLWWTNIAMEDHHS